MVISLSLPHKDHIAMTHNKNNHKTWHVMIEGFNKIIITYEKIIIFYFMDLLNIVEFLYHL